MDKEDSTRMAAEKTALSREVKRKLKNLKRAIENAEKSLKESLSWADVYHEAMLLQSNLYRISKGMEEVIISDWEEDNRERRLLLNPLIEPHREIAQRFKRSKKLRSGIPHWERIKKQATTEYLRYETIMQRIEHALSMEELKEIRQQIFPQKPAQKASSSAKTNPALPYKIFLGEGGLEIWVGKNARAHDLLTFHHANGLDWWLHARNVPGSHVVLRIRKGKEPDNGSLKDALQLALAYSKSPEEGEICITQCKYVVRLGKIPGKVQLSKQRSLYVKKDTTRLQLLKARKERSQ
jgi:predicted ribosome quality control (RQC) complex YloA/Tae2 family protein